MQETRGAGQSPALPPSPRAPHRGALFFCSRSAGRGGHLRHLDGEGGLGGAALRLLLRRPLAAGADEPAVVDLVDEALVVVGPALLDETIERQRAALRLRELLE